METNPIQDQPVEYPSLSPVRYDAEAPASTRRPRPRTSRTIAALGFAVATLAVAAIGGATSRPGLWYRSLRKSRANPPDHVFGPVWTALYAAMAFSAWRVWRAPSSPARTRALGLWAAQLGLNGAWSPTFFAARSPKASLAIVTALLPVLAAYLRAAWKVDRLAAAVLAPYLGWTGFATYLNAQVVNKNRFRL